MVDTKILDTLSLKIEELLSVIRTLKSENALMAKHVQDMKVALASQVLETGRWRDERQIVRDRVVSALDELDYFSTAPSIVAEVNGEE